MCTFLRADVGKTIDPVTDCNQNSLSVASFGYFRYIAGGFNGSLSCFHGFFI